MNWQRINAVVRDALDGISLVEMIAASPRPGLLRVESPALHDSRV